MSDNEDQRQFWSDEAGPKWVERQNAMDANLKNILDGVLSRAGLQQGHSVLDIGCGTGTSALLAADLVGPSGRILGADISVPMTEMAKERAASHTNIQFVIADAAEYDFDQDSVDRVISRFGVMLFNDSVKAFKNIKTAMKPGATLTFAAWGQVQNNPFFTKAAAAAKSVVEAPPRPDLDGPGPFAFRDADRVIGILQDAGLTNVACDTANESLTPLGTLSELAIALADIGPAQAALEFSNANDDQRRAVIDALVREYQEYDTPDGLRIPAEIHYFTASA